MADKNDGASCAGSIAHFPKTFSLKGCVTNSQHFVDKQNLRLQVRGDGKRKAQIHAAGIMFHRRVNELIDFGERNDFIKPAANLLARHAQHSAVKIHIFSASQFRMKTCTYFQH